VPVIATKRAIYATNGHRSPFFAKNAERRLKNTGMPYKKDTYAFHTRAERARNATGTEMDCLTMSDQSYIVRNFFKTGLKRRLERKLV
jgi:hypothetical protein